MAALGQNEGKAPVTTAKALEKEFLPRHVAIIMDGNGRWAQKRGMPRTFGHKAGVEALRNGDEDVAALREEYNGRRRYLLHRFKEMGLSCFEPFGAFYVFPCIKEFGMTSEEFATELLNQQKLAVVPGTAFGDCGEGFLRISYAYSLDNLKKAMDRMEAFITDLRKRS